ncbi:MAG: MFS transporter, partial [Chromatiales bacterium]|nr:MFS transporter [Chromatiales bacterium]
SSYGLFLEPITTAHGWDRETFAIALAIQNLLWGLGVPIAGAIADRFGPVTVIAAGAVTYALGTWAMGVADTPFMFNVSAGLLTGIGVAFTSFSLAMACIARVVGPERRTLALGLGASAGSMGQVVFSPLSLLFINQFGWSMALTLLAGCLMLMIPLAFVLPKDASEGHVEKATLSLKHALAEAMRHRGFVLLCAGFFVCGFHVSFISVHFPAYVVDLGLDSSVAAYALALIGLVNIIGAFLGGAAGQRWSKKSTLSVIYFLRGLLFAGLIIASPSAWTIYAFAVGMGFLWLSTVPLTGAIVGQVFGLKWMGALFGLTMLAHQFGSVLGVWLGGWVYDTTGTYELVWWTAIALAFVAAGLHWPIDERPVARLSAAAQPA